MKIIPWAAAVVAAGGLAAGTAGAFDLPHWLGGDKPAHSASKSGDKVAALSRDITSDTAPSVPAGRCRA